MTEKTFYKLKNELRKVQGIIATGPSGNEMFACVQPKGDHLHISEKDNMLVLNFNGVTGTIPNDQYVRKNVHAFLCSTEPCDTSFLPTPIKDFIF